MVQRPKSSARKKVATAKKLLAEVEEKESTRKQEAWAWGLILHQFFSTNIPWIWWTVKSVDEEHIPWIHPVAGSIPSAAGPGVGPTVTQSFNL